MKTNSLLLSLFLLSGLALELPAQADVKVNPGNSKTMHGGKYPPKDVLAFFPDACPGPKDGVMQSLSLSDDQLQKMVNLRDKFNIATAAKGAEMRSLFHQIGAELAQPTIDKKALNDLHARSAKLQAELSDEHFKFMTENAEILTPEQRKKLHQSMLKHQAGPGGEHMPPPPFMGPMTGGPMPPNMMYFRSGGPGMFGPPGMGHPGMGHPGMGQFGGHPPGPGMPSPDGPPGQSPSGKSD